MSRFRTIFLFFASIFVCLHGLPNQLPTSSIRHVRCPPGNLIRSAGSHANNNQRLNPAEQTYIQSRRQQVVGPAYKTYLANVQRSLSKISSGKMNGSNSSQNLLPDYVKNIFTSQDLNILPRTALAASGGGFRATLFSAGVLNAFDVRNQTSAEIGTGGLLQACDYITGLSGGSWMVTALAQADFPPLYELALGKSRSRYSKASDFGGLLLQYDLFNPASNETVKDLSKIDEINKAYTADVIEKMSEKLKAGFFVTIADFWSLILRYHIIDGTNEQNFFDQSVPHGLDVTFSSIQRVPTFQRFQQPFPIILALPISPNQDETKLQPEAWVPLTNTVYEFTPVESGSWDTNLASFISTQYLGTRLKSGKPNVINGCVEGFDQASYFAAISSDIFPTSNTSEAYFFEKSSIHPIASLINTTFSSQQPGISIDTASVPNPFLGLGTDKYLDKSSIDLRLMDGGADGAVTPYGPLLIPARKLDVIIGIDCVSLVNDGKNAPNYATGASLQATFARAQLFPGEYSFPKVPNDPKEYEKLRDHPTFFGCEETAAPLIVWLPNAAPLDGSKGMTNASVDQIHYEPSQVSAIITGASEIAYRGFPTTDDFKAHKYRDPLWPACLACAVADRSRSRQKIRREGICSKCFERYCWAP
ncbi:hypothetical protein CROQUDRAFT_46269 [Cronartium quercuum f. sp. fusiforme G11]|uniref:Lysophospholipase n=1 Tax=Cronartium quercuum f. sp. fusiforme G11 TaxID=708437 RepID=A0A9P6NE68_9BASI|nr:hypothetical protein CROQUDRAFT_46269 [Cronartium quercuum f. sp. fusiforme G11]